MSAPNVRSATVRLNAEVAKYIADMKAAGRATDEAFSKADRAVQQHNDSLGDATDSTRDLSKETTRLDQETTKAGRSIEKTSRATKELSLESAIAEERTSRLRKSLREQAKAAVDAEHGLEQAASAADRAATSNDRNSRSIDKYSGRLGLILKGVGVLGPTIAPISVAAVAGLAAISAQAGFAAAGVGSLVIAFQGVGDALTKVNKAVLVPTETNIANALTAMKDLGPAAQDFVVRMSQLRPVLHELRDSAAGGFFPGMIEAVDSFEAAAPHLETVLHGITSTLGGLVANGAASLGSARWFDFIDFIGKEAPPALSGMGHALGSLTHGFAELMMAFDPVNDSMLDWLVRSSAAFDQWAGNLSATQGFQEFLAYLHQTGPQVGAALVAISNALLQIGEAAAPLGGPVLRIITELANVIAAIADSPLGTPIMAGVTALSALSLAGAAATAAVARLDAALVSMGIAGATAGRQAAVGVTETGAAATAASAGRGAGTGIGLGLPTLAVTAAVLSTADAIQGAADGTYNWGNALMRSLVPGIHTAELLGIKIPEWAGGAKEATDDAADSTAALAHEMDVQAAQAAITAEANRRAGKNMAQSLFGPQLAMLRTQNRAARLQKVIEDQNKAIRNTADAWFDYSQKIDLSGPSLDDVLTRWHTIGVNAEAEGKNITAALKNGIDPGVIQNLIKTLGPQGAAGAIAELATVSKSDAKQINKAFGFMTTGVQGFRHGLRDAVEAATNARATLKGLGDIKTHPKIDADTKGFDGKSKHVRNDLDEFSHLNAIPSASLDDKLFKRRLRGVTDDMRTVNATVAEATADLDTGPLKGGIASAERLLIGFNGKRADAYIYVHTVRLGGDTAGGPQAPGAGIAEGGTVPGPRHPYGDKVFAHLAPGEEVITNRHGEADRFRADRASGRIPAYADGGTVRRTDNVVLTRSTNSKADEEVRKEAEQRKRLNSELKASTKAVEAERKERDRIVDRMHQLEDSIRSALKTDLGADSSADPWSSGAAGGTFAGDLAILHSDTARGRRFNRLRKILENKGFDGPALEDLLSRGDLTEIQSFANRSSGQLHRFEEAFGQRAHVLTVASREGADAALGGRLDAANAELHDANQKLHHIQGELKHNRKQNHKDHQDDRQAQQRGASRARRNKRHD